MSRSLPDRIPDDAAAIALRMDRNHGALRDQPGAVGLSSSEPFLNGIVRGLVRRAPDGSTYDVNASAQKADIVRMASKARGAEVLHATPSVWEGSRRMFSKESPYIEIFHTMLATNEMLGTALA